MTDDGDGTLSRDDLDDKLARKPPMQLLTLVMSRQR